MVLENELLNSSKNGLKNKIILFFSKRGKRFPSNTCTIVHCKCTVGHYRFFAGRNPEIDDTL